MPALSRLHAMFRWVSPWDTPLIIACYLGLPQHNMLKPIRKVLPTDILLLPRSLRLTGQQHLRPRPPSVCHALLNYPPAK